jgi:hypothetical protein
MGKNSDHKYSTGVNKILKIVIGVAIINWGVIAQNY